MKPYLLKKTTQEYIMNTCVGPVVCWSTAITTSQCCRCCHFVKEQSISGAKSAGLHIAETDLYPQNHLPSFLQYAIEMYDVYSEKSHPRHLFKESRFNLIGVRL